VGAVVATSIVPDLHLGVGWLQFHNGVAIAGCGGMVRSPKGMVGEPFVYTEGGTIRTILILHNLGTPGNSDRPTCPHP
jgi:hypothetical protein